MNTTKVFLTDSDFVSIFGSEIARIVQKLGEYGNEKCMACGGKCCREIGCGLYSDKFSFCPIYEIRPRECRYHFCHDILNDAPLDNYSKELLNKPIKDLAGGEQGKLSELFPLFPNFMVDAEGLKSLGIKEQVDSVLEAFKNGRILEEQARDILKTVCLCTEK